MCDTKMRKNILIIGVGGVGSFFVDELFDVINKGVLNHDLFLNTPIEVMITLADQDIVELEQLEYQNFLLKDVGKNKAMVLASTIPPNISFIPVIPYTDRIVAKGQLGGGFDIIVLCVDNDVTRKLVFEYCHEKNVEFIDLRATGRNVFAMTKQDILANSLKYVDEKDKKEYSCQDKDDYNIQIGNRISAIIGVQMLINLLRGQNSKIVSLRI